MGFYDNSPSMVDDLPPVAAPAPAPTVAPAGGVDAQPPATDHAAADALYAPAEVNLTPDAVREWRKANDDPATQFFNQTADAAIESGVNEFVRGDGGTDSTQHHQATKALALEITALARDVGMLGSDAMREFAPALREVRALDEVGRVQLAADAQAALVREFGAKAEEALNGARALVARDPRVLQVLNSTGLGNHPAIVTHLAREAMKQRASGRLK